MAKPYVLSLSLCLIFLFHGCLSTQQQKQHQGQTQSQHQFRGEQRQCRIDNLDALEPTHQIEAEAGLIEYWDENNEQFQCAGVTACRITVQPKGLSLPAYYNSPKLIYIVKGKGVLGLLVPGCPETFHSFDHSRQSDDQESRRPSSKDQDSRSQGHEDVHQKLRRVKKGDIIAIPNGVAYWFFNDGDTPVVAVGIADTGNNLNQLDDRMRKFYLAGNVQEQEQQHHHHHQQQQRGSSSSGREKAEEESFGNNIFSGFDAELLAQAFGVEKETVRKLQGKNDERGRIIHVEEGLQVIRSISSEEEEEQQEQQRQNQMKANGLEESFCNMRFRQNIGKATSADVYTPFGGRVTNVNSQSLPILSFLDLSAERGYLYKNSMMSPHWNMNAHSVIYVLNGEARVQIVANYGQAVFDGQLREGQIVIIPQNFAVVKQAADNGFEWVSFKTSDNAMKSPLAGRASTIRAMPEEVLVNVYQISNEEAKRLKFSRDELIVFGPRSESY